MPSPTRPPKARAAPPTTEKIIIRNYKILQIKYFKQTKTYNLNIQLQDLVRDPHVGLKIQGGGRVWDVIPKIWVGGSWCCEKFQGGPNLYPQPGLHLVIVQNSF